MNYTVQQRALEAFNRDMASKSGRGRDFISTQGFLRDEFKLTAAAAATYNNVAWTLTQLQTGTAQTVNANRLKTDDAFLVTQVFVYLGSTIPASGSDTTNPALQAELIQHTFPNGLVFVAADALALQIIYNGYVSVKQASTTYFERLMTKRFYRVGTAQQATLVFTASNTLRDTWEGNNYGYWDVETPFRMAGNKNYDVNLVLPAAMTMAAQGGASNVAAYVGIEFGGFLATGCANFI